MNGVEAAVIGSVSQTAGGLFSARTSRRRDDSAQGGAAAGPDQLTPEEQQQVAQLRRRDAEVRTHEAAHQAVGGAHAGGAGYTYQRGPDGKSYAIGGEVQVDLSRESTPEATIAKMEQIKAAALAPAEPSGQDRSVASQADAIKADAQRELRENQRAESAESGENAGEPAAGGSARNRRAVAAYAAADAVGRAGGVGGYFAVSA